MVGPAQQLRAAVRRVSSFTNDPSSEARPTTLVLWLAITRSDHPTPVDGRLFAAFSMVIAEKGQSRVPIRSSGCAAVAHRFLVGRFSSVTEQPGAGVAGLPGTEPTDQMNREAPRAGLHLTVPEYAAVRSYSGRIRPACAAAPGWWARRRNRAWRADSPRRQHGTHRSEVSCDPARNVAPRNGSITERKPVSVHFQATPDRKRAITHQIFASQYQISATNRRQNAIISVGNGHFWCAEGVFLINRGLGAYHFRGLAGGRVAECVAGQTRLCGCGVVRKMGGIARR